MLESGLFFTLGFLAAALLALMVAPAIWRRAVVLTRQRIESSVPLTLNEIQADKDQLRAEFAMSTRRLEVSLEELKERASEQVIEINRRRDEVLSLEEEQKEKATRIVELKSQAEELHEEMRSREEKLSAANTSLASVEVKLEEKALEFENLDRRYKNVVDEFDDQKIELVARGTRLGNVDDEIRDLRQQAKDQRDELASANDETKAATQVAKREKERNLQLEKKITRLQTTMSDLENRLERRDRDLAAMRDKSKDSESRVSSKNIQSDKLRSDNLKLKAELAEAALRTEALLKDASGENVENAVAIFENERKDLRSQLQESETAREELKIALSAVELSSGDDWEIERRENAIVRERINDLAARVTAMTAAIEGPGSTINKALGNKDGKSGRKGSNAGSASSEVSSLADRIRALQDAAEKA